MATTFRSDIHLYPLYLKWASDSFHKGNSSEGFAFFRLVCDGPRETEHKVYKQLYKIHRDIRRDHGNIQRDHEYGRKAFHNAHRFFSSSGEKAQAIDKALRKVDRHELSLRENKVHGCLWTLHRRYGGDREREYGKHAFNHTHGRSSTLGERFLAARMYANESRPFSWLMNNETVHLIKREDGELEIVIVTSGSEKIRTIPFDREGHPIEEAISHLKNCDVTIERDSVILSRLLPIENFGYRFPNGSKEIRLLLKGRTTLVWHEYDNLEKKASWINVSEDGCQTILSLTRLSNEDRTLALREGFTMEVSDNPHSGKLDSVTLTKISFCSQMDPSNPTAIDWDNWAVTLISCGFSSGCNPSPGYHVSLDPGFGHAMIIFEGVKDGTQFVRFFHLTTTTGNGMIDIPEGQARVAVGNYIIDPNSINAKTPTWVRPRALVQRIEEENRRLYLFNRTGNPLLSSQLNENLAREVTHVFLSACLDAVRETSLPSSSGRVENRFISALIPNDVPPFIGRIGNVFLSSLADNAWNALVDPHCWVYDYNCLTLAIRKMREFGIGLPTPETFLAAPTAYIRSVASDPSRVRINNI